MLLLPFDGPHVWDKPGLSGSRGLSRLILCVLLSGFLVCLVWLVDSD